jgi:putative ATP-dependent endonuclease of OLD family
VSEKWTFEYCLARSGLAELVYEAVGGTSEGFKELSDNSEIRAVQIYRHIETKSGAKTDVAYRLAAILEREYGVHGKREQLKACLPGYILDALSHVTGPWPQDLDAASEPEQLPGANENSERAGYTNSDCNKN